MKDMLLVRFGCSALAMIALIGGCECDNGAKPDNTPPTNVSLIIDGGAEYALTPQVALTLSATDNKKVTGMLISNDPLFSGASWEEYATEKSWTLPAGDGLKTVYAKFKDDAENVSAVTSDDITLDTQYDGTPTIVINEGAEYTTSNTVTVRFSTTAAESMKVSNLADLSDATWEPFDTTKTWIVEPGDGAKVVYALFKDVVGHSSGVVSDSIWLYENTTLVVCDPLTGYVSAGNTVTVDIKILNGVNLVSAYVALNFDPSKVEVTNLKIDDSELTDALLARTGADIIVSDSDIDNANGSVTIGALAQQANFSGVSGDGPIAEVTFQAKVTDPTSDIVFAEATLYDYPVQNPPDPVFVVTFDGHLRPPE